MHKPLPCCHTPTCWINIGLKQSYKFAIEVITRILEESFDVRLRPKNLGLRRYRLKLRDNLLQCSSINVEILMEPATKKLAEKRIRLSQIGM